MADIMLKLKIDPNIVVFIFVPSLYTDSVSYESHFCDF